jgi:hypothetical protein
MLGNNPIVNGGAETGPASSSLTNPTSPAAPDHGFQYFAAGSDTSILTQNIDVSSGSSIILSPPGT